MRGVEEREIRSGYIDANNGMTVPYDQSPLPAL
jgi:hypothetical protein